MRNSLTAENVTFTWSVKVTRTDCIYESTCGTYSRKRLFFY